MPNIEARTVANIVVEQFISRYGAPMHIHSDQGTQFESEMFQVMCELLEFRKQEQLHLDHNQMDKVRGTLEPSLVCFGHCSRKAK